MRSIINACSAINVNIAKFFLNTQKKNWTHGNYNNKTQNALLLRPQAFINRKPDSRSFTRFRRTMGVFQIESQTIGIHSWHRSFFAWSSLIDFNTKTVAIISEKGRMKVRKCKMNNTHWPLLGGTAFGRTRKVEKVRELPKLCGFPDRWFMYFYY